MEGDCSKCCGTAKDGIQVNSWWKHLVLEGACWLQRRSQEGKKRRLPSDWWKGWAGVIVVLVESGLKTGSVGDALQVP